MSFLSATLLLGTLAAGIPVALHLLARQPPRRVVFPAVAFLRQRLTTQSTRLRVRRWWLLALRVLALIVFAILLARPHIASATSGQWTTVGLLLTAAVGGLALASIAWVRGMTRGLAWSLLAAAVLLGGIGCFAAVRAVASGAGPVLQTQQPLAIAIVIDNSPSSAWQIDEEPAQTDADDQTQFDWSGSRLAVAISRSGEMINQLPAGSRIAIVDRSTSPVGFSLDASAAQSRLARLVPLPVPAPIAERIASAIELVRTSDLPAKQVVVISDMVAASWQENLPETSTRSPIATNKHEDVPVSLLNIHESVSLAAGDAASAAKSENIVPLVNAWISPPQVADVAPPAGVAIPIRFQIGVWSTPQGSNDSGAASGLQAPVTATVQMSLYERDPALPVVRDQKTVLPKLRSVDRASIELPGNANEDSGKEVLLSLPPLPRGTYHAVIELVGGDSFAWDNKRYVTIDLPTPPRVLIAGNERDETAVMAAAMTAPYVPDDAAASYRIETVEYRDLVAVDWKTFDLVVLLDPPLRYDAAQGQLVGSSDTISSSVLDQIASVVSRGGGLLISMGPSAEVIGVANRAKSSEDQPSSNPLLPPLVRSWRVPSPGTFWRVTASSHPVFNDLMRPASRPNWSDFRVRRYWQLADADTQTWEVIAQYATTADNQAAAHAAVLTRRLGSGRVAVTTTPLPALGSATRNWNDLFGAADAWPAFMTVRSLTAWLAGIDRRDLTVLAGQSVVLPLDRETAEPSPTVETLDEPSQPAVQLYAPDQNIGRSISISQSEVVIGDTETPGTYFLRGPQVWSGLSANLSPVWSNGETTNREVLQAWFGESGWSVVDDLDELSLSRGAGPASVVSLHGPLALLAVLVFLAEQLLSNRFYGATRQVETA